MNCHVLQHVPFEGLANLEPWLKRQSYSITYTWLYENLTFPEIKDIDLLIIMGGPMSVNDESDHPWLKAEKAFVKRFIEADKPVLGICLGAQLIANVLGAAVYPNSVKEIGWFPITAVYQQDGFQFPETTLVFHWHGETFDLPDGASLLASSEGCTNQAFQIGKVIGLQFHLETTQSSAKLLVEHCPDELIEDAYIQSADTILAAGKDRYAALHAQMANILNHLHSLTTPE